ncbi:aldo/keto reductase [Paludibacter sp. 221]|uniref:aldo/keto reductase n=1 Tax=Paludibacter sp. 221 TaxID=2302939 RepID=UPI0013CFCA89|nr:aldo/keto reductase [Paludibacter sp. 221]NDV47135.1 aldo/keto reductase [Paludibacter sp. 221]
MIYGNEAEIGKALNEAFSSGLVAREDLFITSKLWNSYHDPEHVEKAIQQSLQDLQIDYLDLYLMHWPIAFRTGYDQAENASELVSLDEQPLSTTWEAMAKLQEKGLTKHIGVSNFNIPKIQKLINDTSIVPEMNQIEIHPYFQQNELVTFCQKNEILVTAYSPLGSRKLTSTGKGPDKEDIILSIAKEHNATPAQVMLAWGMERNTIVIPKSVNKERIKENFGSVNVKLNDEDMAKIATLDRNQRLSTGAFAVFADGPYTPESIWEE